MRYKIFPAIGIARLGQDDDFFVAPERPGFGPTEAATPGTSVTRFKNAARTRIRKQAARFHLFESEDGVRWQPAQLPSGAKIEWSVALINKKSAVRRPAFPPVSHERPHVPAENRTLLIDGGIRTIAGPNRTSAPLVGTFTATGPNGTAYSTSVMLGELRTDADGRLLVLGGSGHSSAPPGTALGPGYYVNPNWHDDVADGPINATVQLPNAASQIAEGGAWIIVAPPDFAPEIRGVVTLYDVIRQVGVDHFGLPVPDKPSFDEHIAPLIRRTSQLRWVHEDATWQDPRLSNVRLRSRASEDQPLRDQVRTLIVNIKEIFDGHTEPHGPPWELREFQKGMLGSWVSGQFDDTPADAMGGVLTASGLTEAALESAVGQGFCPGIEAGIIVQDPTLYSQPFDYRVDQQSVQAGDLTALMAQPWQADFLKCHTEWWPTQRPDIAPQPDGSTEPWVRGVQTHLDLVKHLSQLGFVVRKGESEVFVEAERDPEFAPP